MKRTLLWMVVLGVVASGAVVALLLRTRVVRGVPPASSDQDARRVTVRLPDSERPAPARGLDSVQARYSAEVKSNLLEQLRRPMFKEIAAEAGIGFRHSANPELRPVRAQLEIPMDIAGGGVSAGDYNGDGHPDLFFAGFGGGRLYRNEGGVRFVDATADAGLRLQGESRAAYFIDYDNDGDLDIFLTTLGDGIRLFESNGAGRFTEITVQVGLGAYHDITHEAVFCDLDGDGLIDIYTASFGRWDRGDEPVQHRHNTNAEPNRLYHHLLRGGKHFFEEIGAKAGVDDRGWTHCVGAWDVDQDGKVDLFSFNDFGPAQVYHNLGNLRFRDWSEALAMREANNGMGFALLDLHGAGLFAAYVTEISVPVFSEGAQVRYRARAEATVLPDKTLDFLSRTVNNRLYTDTGTGHLDNRHTAVFEPAEMGWSWDGSPIDYDNDGDLDFLVLNGTEDHAPTVADEMRVRHLAQRAFIQRYANDANLFFVNVGGFLYDVSGACELGYRGNSRSSAFLDFDGDGDLDIAINDFEGKARLFRNLSSNGNSWIRLRLVGTRSNRNALGARVTVQDSEQRTQRAIVVSGTGFLSEDPLELHFGLGKARRVTRVAIRWPSGSDQNAVDLEIDRLHTITER